MAFAKTGSINTIYWNCILVSTKCKTNTQHWVIYSVVLSVICLYRAAELKESIFRGDQSVMLSFQQVVQRALKSPVTTEQAANSSFI